MIDSMQIIFNALDMPDGQRLLAVLGMMQICPDEFQDSGEDEIEYMRRVRG